MLAIGLSVVELLNSLSMSLLPGSWYALLKSSNIGFSMMLSSLVLEKSYHWGQILGAGFVMSGVGVVFFLGSKSGIDSGDHGAISMTLASSIALAGAFLNAACNVIAEGALKKTLREEENRMLENDDSRLPASKLLLSNSFSMWTSFFSFTILAIPAAFLRDANLEDQPTLDLPSTAEDFSYTLDARLMLGLCFGFLTISRLGERLSKHWICVADSAVTFSLVSAARRQSGVFILAALFHESFPKSMIAGSIASGMGFALHFWFEHSISYSQGDQPGGSQQYELVATASPDVVDCGDAGGILPLKLRSQQAAAHDPIHKD